MVIYFRNSVFVLLFCLIIFSIGIKATETISKEKELLLPKFYSSIQERTDYHNNIEIFINEFENFEDLTPHEQENLLYKWDEMIQTWMVEKCLTQYGLLDSQHRKFIVSKNKQQKLKRIERLYKHQQKKHSKAQTLCMIF